MVTVTGVLLLVSLAVFGALAYWRHLDAYYLVLAGLGVVGVVIVIVRLTEMRVAAIGVLDLPGALVVFFVAAEGVGLPPPVAKRLGVGFRSREWEYDRALSRVISRIQGSLSCQQGGGHPVDRLVRAWLPGDGGQLIARLRALRAPDGAWRRLTGGYADEYEAWFDLIGTPSEDQLLEVGQRIRRLHEERERLRTEGRAKAAALVADSRMGRLTHGTRGD